MNYLDILNEALMAASAAQKKKLEPYGGKEPELACGFAWVNISPATHPFVKACKAKLKAQGLKYDASGNLMRLDGSFAREVPAGVRKAFGAPGYPKGWQFWGPGDFHGQWVDCKEAGAQAFCNVLQKYDIPASWGSRLD